MKKYILLLLAMCAQVATVAQTKSALPFSMTSLEKEMQLGDETLDKYVYMLYDVDGDGRKELFVKEKVKEYNMYYGFVIKKNKEVEEVFSRTSGGYEDFGYTDDGFMWHYEEHTGGLSQITSYYKLKNSKVVYSTHRDIEMPSQLEGEEERDMEISYHISNDKGFLPASEMEYDEYVSHGNTISLYKLEGWKTFPAAELKKLAKERANRPKVQRILGDLNKDGLIDEVLIETPRNKANMVIRESDGYEYNFNQPVMSISFSNGQGYKLFKKYNNVIPHPESEAECVDLHVSITEKGVLKINYSLFMSMGSYGTSEHTYLYRYQNGDFYLIGEEYTNGSRNTGDTEKVSINYLTHKKQTVKSNSFKETKPVEKWSTIPKKPLEKLGTRNLKE